MLSSHFILGVLRFPSNSPSLYGLEPDGINTMTFPLITFAAYQAAIAIVTPALISGAVVGRMKLVPYIFFVFLWTTVCYDPLCRWAFYSQGNLLIYELSSKGYRLRLAKTLRIVRFCWWNCSTHCQWNQWLGSCDHTGQTT